MKNDVNNIEERLAKVESDMSYQIEEFGSKKQEAERSFREKNAETRVTIDRFQSEIQRLNGKIEELEHRLSQFNNIAEQNQRLLAGYNNNQPPAGPAQSSEEAGSQQNSSEQNVLPVPGQSQNQQSDSETSGSPVSETQDSESAKPKLDVYDSSKQDFDTGNYKEARAGFEKFLKTSPKSPKAASAQFWIGECYYREQMFDNAVLEYQKVIEKFPKSNKAPAAYLKQAYAFEKFGDKSASQDVLKELIKKFPGAKEAEIAAKKLKTMKK